MMPSMPPDGFEDEPTTSGPPDGFADETPTSSSSRYLGGMASNALSMSPLGMASKGANAAIRGIGELLNKTAIPVPKGVQNVATRIFQPARALGIGAAESAASGFTGQSPLETTMKTMEAFKPGYEPRGFVQKMGAFVGENAPVVAAGIVNPSFAGPLAVMAQQAQTGAVSPLPASIPVAQGARGLFQATGLAKRVVPPLLKSTKGIPTEVSKMALEDPGIVKLPGTSESIQGRSQDIINAIKEANQKVGKQYGETYSRYGMKSPVERIVESGKPQEISFEKLRSDYQSAVRGDLLKGLSTEEQLATLTDLKRSLQDQAIYAAPGQQLSPSQGSYNSAIKRMASDIDDLRGTIPGGDKLAMADDAYAEIKELSHRLTSAFKDPYTGQDYLNRILKGNTDWLTSGRNAGKIGAIERIEQITGKQVLKPALQEMAAAYLNNPDVLSLPSFGLGSIISALIPTKMFFGSNNLIRGVGAGLSETAPVTSNRERLPIPLRLAGPSEAPPRRIFRKAS